MKFKLYILLVFVTPFIEVKAQDPVFTQFLIVPETLNTGIYWICKFMECRYNP